jgi:hypothetical protein
MVIAVTSKKSIVIIFFASPKRYQNQTSKTQKKKAKNGLSHAEIQFFLTMP